MLKEGAMDPNCKLCQAKPDVNRDSKEIRRDRKLMYLNIEGKINSLLGGGGDLRQRIREDQR